MEGNQIEGTTGCRLGYSGPLARLCGYEGFLTEIFLVENSSTWLMSLQSSSSFLVIKHGTCALVSGEHMSQVGHGSPQGQL